MTLTSRPIVFTADIPAWRHLLDAMDAMGAVVVEDEPGWVVYALGSGRVALHDAEPSRHRPGHVVLEFETPDASAWSASTGIGPVIEDADHGRSVRVDSGDGLEIWVSEAPPGTSDAGAAEALSVLPLWCASQVEQAGAVLHQLGARPRVTGDRGGWRDFTCPGGGLVAVHAIRDLATPVREAADPGAEAGGVDDPRVVLSFEHDGDLEPLRARLVDAGLDPVVVDETYSRVLQVADPDGGAPLWVNQAQTDLYGYTRADT